jgi:hypothetical protein
MRAVLLTFWAVHSWLKNAFETGRMEEAKTRQGARPDDMFTLRVSVEI